MKFLLNQGYSDERVIEADYFDYRADNEFVTFWKQIAGERTAIYTLRAASVQTIEAQPNA
jgi:hypothetical protein